MATSLLALLDDIASVLDDDLALNAQQVAGVKADRELPVVWAVAKGSLLNKVILVPAALGIVAFAPWLIKPLLMLGGAYPHTIDHNGRELTFMSPGRRTPDHERH